MDKKEVYRVYVLIEVHYEDPLTNDVLETDEIDIFYLNEFDNEDEARTYSKIFQNRAVRGI